MDRARRQRRRVAPESHGARAPRRGRRGASRSRRRERWGAGGVRVERALGPKFGASGVHTRGRRGTGSSAARGGISGRGRGGALRASSPCLGASSRRRRAWTARRGDPGRPRGGRCCRCCRRRRGGARRFRGSTTKAQDIQQKNSVKYKIYLLKCHQNHRNAIRVVRRFFAEVRRVVVGTTCTSSTCGKCCESLDNGNHLFILSPLT